MARLAEDAATPEPASASRGLALLRLAFVPVALAAASERVPLDTDLFPAALAAFGLYAIATLAVATRGAWSRGRPAVGQALVDLAFIAALVYTSGGARSPLRFAFFVLPIGAALRLSPRVTAGWSAAALGAYLVVAIPHPGTTLPGDLDLLLAQCAALIWVSAAAVMLSALVGRRERSLEALAAARRRLVEHSLDAEARERRRLAQALHDEALQDVLLARQEVADLARGVPGAAERAQHALDETARQIREEVFAMHPVGLERAGLAAVLRTLADDAARRGRFQARVEIEPATAGLRHDLLVATARELLGNAAKHSRAAHVDVSVVAAPDGLRLTVSDDGVGLPDARLDEALAEGHIGLAATIERIRAAGGDVAMESTEGQGTTVTATVPADGAAAG